MLHIVVDQNCVISTNRIHMFGANALEYVVCSKGMSTTCKQVCLLYLLKMCLHPIGTFPEGVHMNISNITITITHISNIKTPRKHRLGLNPVVVCWLVEGPAAGDFMCNHPSMF